MKKNNEVTLRIKGDIENFKEKIIEKGYEEFGHFILNDIFMIPNNLKITEMSTREIISKAVIIRKVEVIDKREIKQDLVYKIKKFNDKGEILEQTSIRLKILDCDDAEKFMTAIGYEKIMNIIEEDYEYRKDNFSLTTKDIKDGDKLIEVETQINGSNYDTIDKIKKKLIEEKIPLDFSDCFIKKAEIELDKVLGRKEII